MRARWLIAPAAECRGHWHRQAAPRGRHVTAAERHENGREAQQERWARAQLNAARRMR